MNKQGKLINGKVVGGIEWVKRVLPDGTERQGYTWNAVGGCRHECRWTMLDGSEAVQGKQIAHLDGNKLHNSAQNLKPMVTREHVEYDGTDRNLTYRTEPKSDWSPCARCADPDGPVQGHNKTPDRISGERFGIEGQICRRCYGALQERERRRIAREKHAAETACHCDVLKELAEGTMSE